VSIGYSEDGLGWLIVDGVFWDCCYPL